MAQVGKGCPKCSSPRKPKRKRKAPVKKQTDSYQDDFDYDEFIEREFGNKPHKKVGIALHWWLTAVFLLVVLFFLWIFVM